MKENLDDEDFDDELEDDDGSWLSKNWKTLLTVLIASLLLAGIYAYSKQSVEEDGVVSGSSAIRDEQI